MDDARRLIEGIGGDDEAAVIALADAMFGLEDATQEESWAYLEDAQDALARLRERGFDVTRVVDAAE